MMMITDIVVQHNPATASKAITNKCGHQGRQFGRAFGVYLMIGAAPTTQIRNRMPRTVLPVVLNICLCVTAISHTLPAEQSNNVGSRNFSPAVQEASKAFSEAMADSADEETPRNPTFLTAPSIVMNRQRSVLQKFEQHCRMEN